VGFFWLFVFLNDKIFSNLYTIKHSHAHTHSDKDEGQMTLPRTPLPGCHQCFTPCISDASTTEADRPISFLFDASFTFRITQNNAEALGGNHKTDYDSRSKNEPKLQFVKSS